MGKKLQTYVTRDKSGIKRGIYPCYQVYLSDKNTFLFAAKKQTKNRTSNYIISMSEHPSKADKKSQNYLGKVRANFIGTEFVGYDDGRNPTHHENVHTHILRKELCAVMYEKNIFGAKGPRKMTVLIPNVTSVLNVSHSKTQLMHQEFKIQEFEPLTEDSVLLAGYHADSMKGIKYLHNRSPKWSESYVFSLQLQYVATQQRNTSS